MRVMVLNFCVFTVILTSFHHLCINRTIESITSKHNQDLQEDKHAQEHKMYPGKPSQGRKPNNLCLKLCIYLYKVR